MNLRWKANYIDGTSLSQFNQDGTENKYKDIDRYNLSSFSLINQQGKTVYRVYLQQNQRLIFRRRNFIQLNNTQERHTIYLVGWQQTILTPSGDKNITALNYIYEDGSIALDNSRNNLELLDGEL